MRLLPWPPQWATVGRSETASHRRPPRGPASGRPSALASGSWVRAVTGLLLESATSSPLLASANHPEAASCRWVCVASRHLAASPAPAPRRHHHRPRQRRPRHSGERASPPPPRRRRPERTAHRRRRPRAPYPHRTPRAPPRSPPPTAAAPASSVELRARLEKPEASAAQLRRRCPHPRRMERPHARPLFDAASAAAGAAPLATGAAMRRCGWALPASLDLSRSEPSPCRRRRRGGRGGRRQRHPRAASPKNPVARSRCRRRRRRGGEGPRPTRRRAEAAIRRSGGRPGRPSSGLWAWTSGNRPGCQSTSRRHRQVTRGPAGPQSGCPPLPPPTCSCSSGTRPSSLPAPTPLQPSAASRRPAGQRPDPRPRLPLTKGQTARAPARLPRWMARSRAEAMSAKATSRATRGERAPDWRRCSRSTSSVRRATRASPPTGPAPRRAPVPAPLEPALRPRTRVARTATARRFAAAAAARAGLQKADANPVPPARRAEAGPPAAGLPKSPSSDARNSPLLSALSECTSRNGCHRAPQRRRRRWRRRCRWRCR
mmetsp:Transcript_156096/g.500646  ORF Transcript_156096/g.500646 Transcript_156096/m.500646 type:complete len:546 (+) Transcript_156096:1215-2852(+)